MKKKHTFACAFMAVAIVAAIPLGINRSMSRLQEEAAGSYYYDQAGYAIYEGLEKRQDAAGSLITLAERYVEKEPSLEKLIDNLNYHLETSRRAYDYDNTFTKAARANLELDDPALALANALQQVELAEKDKKYPAQLIDQMKSEQDKINRSSYNDEARAFNAKLKRLKPIALVKPMATFDTAGDSIPVEETAAVEDTGIPSPPDAPDYDVVAEQAEAFAGEAANRAEEFADGVETWAEDLDDEITGRVTDALGG